MLRGTKKLLKAKLEWEEQVFKTNNYGTVVVTEYVNASKVHVKFVDTGYETVASIANVKLGNIKDRSAVSVHGVGIIGDEPTKINRKHLKEYILWTAMLQRCYDSKFHSKRPTYKDCTVSENFRYYTYFKEWCSNQIGFNNDGWSLEKDILIKGNKIYSEHTACFVPREVNDLFTKSDKTRGNLPVGVCYCKSKRKFVGQISTGKGVQDYLGAFNTSEEAFLAYKKAKENHIKDVANKWKDQIDVRAYEALMNYEVEITD